MILVFKTNVQSIRQSYKVKSILSGLKSIQKWTFDLEDCDKVLRVVGDDLCPESIEGLLFGAGFYCKELED